MSAKPLRTAADLRKQLCEDIQVRSDVLVGGGARTLEEYRQLVGFISGLRHADALIKGLMDAAIDADIEES